MATVQTLNDKDGNTFYPVTKIEAVYNADGSKTLDYILDHTIIASTNPADATKVFKGDASLSLVGSDNIDFTTSGFAYQVGDTVSTSNYFVAGRLNNSGVAFSIALPKSLANVTSLRIDGTIYIYAMGTTVNKTVSLSSTRKDFNGFDFGTDTFNTELASVTKPSPITVNLDNCTLTFS